MSNALFIVLILLFIVLALFIVPQWRLRRAIHQVIRIFREHNATGMDNSKTMDELGMRSPGILERMLRGRDYKQYALTALMKTDIVQTTEDGRLYLSEEKLLASGLGRNFSPPPKGGGQHFAS